MNLSPPRGLLRWLARLPILLYGWGLGRLLGHRFLLLHHRGRKSGKPRQVVLEVVRHEAGVYVVVSGFGLKADWYQNVEVAPEVMIEVCGQKHRARAELLATEQGRAELDDYARRHPWATKMLMAVFGSGQSEWADLIEVFRVVRLHLET
ncbi:MAG: nitroreductase family deazaflavin-dependent oxidoreductase [Candidatus Eremiobacteraeota bacterium]|nr:nitroreductase family deazaflavin-dependent oxidoreductase [Candidatus Eremiobacteraeota bacterium]